MNASSVGSETIKSELTSTGKLLQYFPEYGHADELLLVNLWSRREIFGPGIMTCVRRKTEAALNQLERSREIETKLRLCRPCRGRCSTWFRPTIRTGIRSPFLLVDFAHPSSSILRYIHNELQRPCRLDGSLQPLRCPNMLGQTHQCLIHLSISAMPSGGLEMEESMSSLHVCGAQ